MQQPFEGDWIYRESSTIPERVRALKQILAGSVDAPISLEPTTEIHEVIVASGNYDPPRYFRHLEALPILFYVDDASGRPVAAGSSVGNEAAILLKVLEDRTGMPVIDNTSTNSMTKHIEWKIYASAEDIADDPAKIDRLMETLARQTGLTLTRERRTFSLDP